MQVGVLRARAEEAEEAFEEKFSNSPCCYEVESGASGPPVCSGCLL